MIVARGAPVAPFLDAPGQVQVLGRDLATHQTEELVAAGLTVVDAPPADRPYVLVSDRTWVTRGALRRFLEQGREGTRLRVDAPAWLDLTGSLQDWPEPGVYEVGWVAAGGAPEWQGLEPVTVDLEFELSAPEGKHPAMDHAMPASIPSSDAGVHQVDHWLHILRINWLSMSTTIERERRAFAASGVFSKVSNLLRVGWKAPSFDRAGIARALSHIDATADIHPTAVVEASVIGPGVTIGPLAVVRGSVLAANATVEEHAICNGSVLGEGARQGRRGMLNLCVLYPGAMVSNGRGHQASIYGRDAFTAETVMIYDLSFKDPIKVQHRGARVSSGTHFLGAAIGHRARLGAEVILGYGAQVPNDAMVVGSAHNVLRSWSPGDGPHRVQDGVGQPVAPRAEPPLDPSGKAR